MNYDIESLIGLYDSILNAFASDVDADMIFLLHGYMRSYGKTISASNLQKMLEHFTGYFDILSIITTQLFALYQNSEYVIFSKRDIELYTRFTRIYLENMALFDVRQENRYGTC